MELSYTKKCRVLYEHVVLANKRKKRWSNYAEKIGVNFNVGPAEQVYLEILTLMKRKENADNLTKVIVKSFNSVTENQKSALLNYFKNGEIKLAKEELGVGSVRTAYRRLEELSEKILNQFITNLQEKSYECLCG